MTEGQESISFPQMEEEILKFWQEEQIFAAQNEKTKQAKSYSFYDGPPFANGLPHYGHLLANTIKDTVSRYWVMQGYKVDRRFGWDCHGLPVEYEIEKREKLKGKQDILKLGIERFNEMCRESVLHYTKEWQRTITRLGRWVDWDDQYRTMDKDYMESVWWVFSELYKKGLIYQGFKVVPYSPRTASVVSNFEANQNYKETQDPAITVKFKVKDENAFFLAWTTTPWTLPANLALAVGAEITYLRVKDLKSQEEWYCGKERLEALYGPKNTEGYKVLAEVSGQELAGKTYEPLFPYYQEKSKEGAFRVLLADFVTANDGTGLVHQAPAFGEDDFFACQKEAFGLVDPLDESGFFKAEASDLQGLSFKEADKKICALLKEKGLLVKHETLVHSYPFDERTDTPLIYRAVPSWYVAVEKFVDRLVANNQEINWVPAHLKDGRMGKWLAHARDWAISRNRYWGTPLPLWICDQDKEHIEVMSSAQELEEKTGSKVEDLHLQHIAVLSYACPHCSGQMHSAKLVFDCWFESGSMPYAQRHYPFAKENNFAASFPADFIAEGLDQTRGWFYTLNVLSTALYDKPAYKNVIVNGVILDAHAKKMSKRHRNYTPPEKLLSQYGADSVRLYMLNSPLLRAENLIFTDQGVKEITRSVLLPLWNAQSFFLTYAEADSWQAKEAVKVQNTGQDNLDRWIVSRFQSLIKTVYRDMSSYKLYLVVPALIAFIDDLTNWYIRCNRRRFWGNTAQKDSKKTQEEAYQTLSYILKDFAKVIASFAPFIADKIYQKILKGLGEKVSSVHLADMPLLEEKYIDLQLEESVALIRKVTNLGRSLRQIHSLKIRQVLQSMTVVTRNEADKSVIAHYESLLKTELNVRQIFFSAEESKYVELSFRPDLKKLGRRLGKDVKNLQAELRKLNESPQELAKLLARLENKESISLIGHQFSLEDFLVDRKAKEGLLVATAKGVTVLLDTHISTDLKEEGFARELVNRVQSLRKQAGLHVADRIELQVVASKDLKSSFATYQDYISSETLAKSLILLDQGEELSFKHIQSYEIEGASCVVALEKMEETKSEL